MIYYIKYFPQTPAGLSRRSAMKKWIGYTALIALLVIALPAVSAARGTRYFITWPKHHIGPVYVQVYDIRCNPPYEVLDRFRVLVTWDKETKCYDIGNIGVYTLKFYKYKYDKTPMIISGNAASFKIRYMLCPPWI